MEKYLYLKFYRLTGLFFLLPYFLYSSSSSFEHGNKNAGVFKENKGQMHDQQYKARPDILLMSTDDQINFQFKRNSVSYQLSKVESWALAKSMNPKYDLIPEQKVPDKITLYRVDIHWLNCDESPEIIVGEPLAGHENFYNETCPQGALNVQSYEQIEYKNLYNGINMKWYFKDGAMKYEYLLDKAEDFKKINFKIHGAEKLFVNNKGQLEIVTPLGTMLEDAPIVLQGDKVLTSSWKVSKEKVVSFDIKGFDPQLALIIDPLVRLWGTYVGGSGHDYLWNPVVDNNGNIYASGQTTSISNLATSGAFQTTIGGTLFPDAFATKYNSAGIRQWATYYGGAEQDFASYILADPFGNVFMCGGTTSTNSAVMSTPGSHQTQASTSTATNGIGEGFLVKFNSTGARLWATYYGGQGDEQMLSLALDGNNNIYVTGYSSSTDFSSISTPGCHQPANGGTYIDAFLVKFNTNGTRLWGTFYGGSSSTVSSWGDVGYGSATDRYGNIYMCGYTDCSTGTTIATQGSHQPAYNVGVDAFIVKFDSLGVRKWGTYYGGVNSDLGNFIAVDSAAIYLVGRTIIGSGTSIATPGSHQPVIGSVNDLDGYLVKFDLNGVRQWGTYYGGQGTDEIFNVAADSSGYAYVFGWTTSANTVAIATPCSYQENKAPNEDSFMAKFSPGGQRLWGSYFGGPAGEYVTGTVDKADNIILAGQTSTAVGYSIATPGSQQPLFGGGPWDGFIVKFDNCTTAVPTIQNPSICAGSKAILKDTAICGIYWYNVPVNGTPVSTAYTFTTGILTSDTTFYAIDISCGTNGPRISIQVTLQPKPNVNVVSNPSVICRGQSATLTASGANTYSWSTTGAGNSIVVNPIIDWDYAVTGINIQGCRDTAYIRQIVSECTSVNEIQNIIDLTVFPNPVSGRLNIYTQNTGLHLDLYTALGQKIIHSEITKAFELDVSELPNGIYFLEIRDEKKVVAVKKIIKE